MADQTPGVIVTKTRDEVRDDFLRFYKNRQPAADVGSDTQPYIDASVAADVVAPLYADAVTIGRGTNLATSAGDWLLQIAATEEIAPRPAVGASGFVRITASAGGTFIAAGNVCRHKTKSYRYAVPAAGEGTYQDGDTVPVQGVDTGPNTNLPAGTVLEWVAPPPGCGSTATVFAQSDGSGLTGGRPADDDRALRGLVSDRRANPPASGNDAEYQLKARQTPALSIQQVFTVPAIRGPGTIALCFTLNPSKPGGARAPNGAQIAAVEAYIKGQFPADDSIFMCDVEEVPTAVAIRVSWVPGASTWLDTSPWPAYIPGDLVRVATLPPPLLGSIRLFTSTPTTNPQVGQTIGFYDKVTGTMKRIRIGAISTVASGLSWDITPDRTNGASDTSFIPGPGTFACPWSESLNLVAPAVISYFDGLGPGEQVATLYDPGLRQRRQPPSPLKWPSLINNRIVTAVQKVSAVEDCQILYPSIPYQTPVGVAATYSNLLTLGDLAIFP